MTIYYATRAIATQRRAYQAGDTVDDTQLLPSELAAALQTGGLLSAAAMESLVESIGNGTYATKRWQRRDVRPSARVFPVMASPPTIAAITTTTALGSGRVFNSVSPARDLTPTEFWRYLGASRPVSYGASSPDFNYVRFSSFTTYSGQAVGYYSVEFYHYGTQVEFSFKGLAGAYQILVDDELVQAAPFTTTTTGSTTYQLITFGSAAVRKIRFRGFNLPWGGVRTAADDMIWASELRGPRVVFLGDSFTGGSNAAGSVLQSWASWMAETLGWYDVYHAYAGGSGLTVNGSGVKYADRLANDVIANAPDIVVVGGNHNDDGTTTATVTAAGEALYQAIRAGLPDAQIVGLSSFWSRGPSVWPTNTLTIRDAVKASCEAVGGLFLDTLEMPLGRTAGSGTLSSSALANATSVATNDGRPSIGSTIQIGTSVQDRRRVTGVSGGGPFTVTLNQGLTNAQSSGAAWTEVGPPLCDGDGYSGATTGRGSSDVFAATDNVHFTDAGHAAAGRTAAAQYSALSAY